MEMMIFLEKQTINTYLDKLSQNINVYQRYYREIPPDQGND